jgi:hypothetical protein
VPSGNPAAEGAPGVGWRRLRPGGHALISSIGRVRAGVMGRLRSIGRGLAVGLYLAVTRTLLVVAVLVPSLYFILNASPFPDRLTAGLRSVLPGSLEFGRIQLSPIPWQVDVLDVHIRAPDGEAVITAGTVRVKLDLVPLVRFLAGRAPELHLHFREVQLEDYEALVDFDTAGHLHLVDAFSTPSDPDAPPPPSTGPKTVVRLTFDRVTGQRGACRVLFPEWDIRVEGVVLDAKLAIVTAPQTHVRVDASSVTWTHGIGHIRAAPTVAAIPRESAVGPGRVDGFVYDWDRIAFRAAHLQFPGLGVEARDGFLAWSENLRHEGVADLTLPPDSPVLRTATTGLVAGPLKLHVEARGDYADPRFEVTAESPALTVGPLDLGRASLAVSGGRDETGRYAFQGIRAESDGPLGKARLEGGTFHPFGSEAGVESSASAALDAEGLDLPDLLRVLGATAPGPPVPMPHTVSGHLEARLDVASWAGRVANLRVAGRLGATLPPGTLLDGTDMGLDLDVEAATAGRFDRPVLQVAEAVLRADGDVVKARGEVDLAAGTLDVTGQVQKVLAPVLPWMGLHGKGRVTLSDLRVRGPLKSPRAQASATFADLEVGPWAAREATGRVRWEDGTVSVEGLEAQTPAGPLGAAGLQVHLLDGAWRPLAAPTLAIQRAAAPVVDLARLPPLKDAGVEGRASLSVERLVLSLKDPLPTLQLRGRVVAARMTAWGRPLSDVQATVEAEGGVLALPSVAATPRTGGVLRGSGTLDLRTMVVKADADMTGVPLALLAGVKETTLRGTLDLQAAVSGALADPALTAHAQARGLAVKDQRFADIDVDAAREPGQDLHLSSDRFLPRMHLNPDSGLAWGGGRFTGAVLMIDLNRVTPQDFWPPVRTRDLWGQMTGNVQLRYGFGPDGVLTASVTAPPDGLRLAFLDREVRLRNVEKLVIQAGADGAVTVRGLALDDGKGVLRACGVAWGADGAMDLRARGAVGAYWLRTIGTVFSVADGAVYLQGTPGRAPGPLPPGCDASIGAEEGALVVRGTPERPLADGQIRLGAVELGVRGLGDQFRVREGGRIVLSATDRRLRAVIPDDGWVRGSWGEGTFTLYGQASFDGLRPDDGEVVLDGAGLRYVEPGDYFVVGNPSLTARFEGLGSPGQSRLRIAGRVAITEGSYHRNFDVLSKAFSGVTGAREARPEGRSLEDSAPWLADADLDVAVTGSRVAVRSKLPVGSTDFELVPDVRVRGKVRAPELWNRIDVLPGGTITYDVVRRKFDVVRGSLDFDGPVGHPRVDVTARTRIELSGTTGSSATAVGTSRYAPDAPGQNAFDQGLLVSLNVTGRYPDVNFALSSNSRAYTQTELLYLVLTGVLPQGNAASGTSGQVISLGLLTEDVTNLAAKLLLGSIVDTINLGVSPQGEVNLDVMAHMGSRLRFETQVEQGSGSSRYRAGFNVRLTDRLSLVGRVRSGDRDQDGTEVGQKYETKLQFRIPLE